MKLLKPLTASACAFVGLIAAGAYSVVYVESSAPNANIQTISDGLWWALNVSSVGDANYYPVTTLGRLIGAVLIVVGYALFTINVAVVVAAIKQHEGK